MTLLRKPTERRCPDETLLAALTEGTLPDAMRVNVVGHVAECKQCQEVVALLARLARVPAPTVDPDVFATGQAAGVASLHRREDVPQQNSRAFGPTRFAVAAAILLAASGTLISTLRPPVAGPPTAASSSSPELRSRLDTAHVTIRVPRDGDVLPSQISWDAVPTSLGYVVSVVGGDGALVWQTSTRMTTAHVEATLEPGRPYYLMVKALLPDGKTLPGRAVSFRVLPR